jgi:uncharacterized protein (TIGR03437 family)
MKPALLSLFIVAAVHSQAADTSVVYVGDDRPHVIHAVATDTAGNTYVTGARLTVQRSGASLYPVNSGEMFVAKLDAVTNERVWIHHYPHAQADAGTAIAVDARGNIYVGSTVPGAADGSQPQGAFVAKLTNDGSRTLWSVNVGARRTLVASMNVSAAGGTLVLGGNVTTDSFGNQTAFVAGLDTGAGRQVWMQQYSGQQLACSGGSSCFVSARQITAFTALDSAGNIYAAGNTNTTDLTTTAGVYREHGYGPYVRKYSPEGTLLWSTYLTDNRVGVGYPVSPADVLSAIAVGADNSLYLTGGGSPNWPTTPGAHRTTYEGPEWPARGPAGPRNHFVAKLSADGSRLLWSTYIGHDQYQCSIPLLPNACNPQSIAIDAAGNAWVTGSENGDYRTKVSADGASVIADVKSPNGSRGDAFGIDARGLLHLTSRAAGLVTLVEAGSTSAPALEAVTNAAGSAATGRVAPGELISIYGTLLGDAVYVNEVRAPVLYASSQQINAIVPFRLSPPERVTVSVRSSATGMETGKAVLAVTAAQPEFFKDSNGNAAAINEDGTLNSARNPAKAGTVVSLWATGAGGWPAGTNEGTVTPVTGPLIHLPLQAVFDFTKPAEAPLFAGAAPGLPAGVFQVNVGVPSDDGAIDGSVVSVNPMVDLELGAPAAVYVSR